jgi:uncharacterized protein with ParB-like and HNH nuclease domain
MEANPVRIVQYFDGEKQSIIPLFQRPYTWNKRNWQTLWEDIMTYYEDDDYSSSHFMGAVVSIPAKTVPVGVSKHLVIDGQQRLTTVAILLCALKDCSDERRAAQIQDYLENRHHEGADNLKLLPTQGDREAYLSIVKSKLNENNRKHLIYECYDFFHKQLNGNDDNGQKIDPIKILEITKTLLQVVMINLGEADDPYVIFESLNAKGEPLTQADLVRNYVLMRFRNSLEHNGEQEKVYREIWLPMESRLALSIGEFLWHYAIKDGNNVKKPKLYSAIKQRFCDLKTTDDVVSQLNEMNKASINYERFLDPSKESNPQLQKELFLLDRFEATISYPILLKLFSAFDNEQFDVDVLLKCLKYLNSFIIRRAACDEKRSALNKLFANISSKIPTEGEHIDEWLGTELANRIRSERWPDDEEFSAALQNNVLYGTKVGRIILEKVELFLAGKEVVDVNNGQITVEHIMPQTLNEAWKIELGSDYEEVHKTYKDSLGNLTLTGMNSELGNMSFVEKKKIYTDSGLALNRQLHCYSKWGKDEIIQRSVDLSKYAIQIWPRYII